MEGYVEIRWHGRAQQGVVTAAKVLAETAIMAGKHVQAFPEFGPERMGAPVRAFNRVSDKPIMLHCSVTSPRIILVADPTLIAIKSPGGDDDSSIVTEGAPKGAVYIVNSPEDPVAMRRELHIKDDTASVHTVDASSISMDTIGRHIPNTAMLGALSSVCGVVELDALCDSFRENYSKKYSAKVIDANVESIKRGFSEVSHGND